MEFADLEAFVEGENQRLRARHEALTDETAPTIQTVKRNEEIGELCASVLAFDSLQREETLDGDVEREVADEVADVLITTFLLADSIGIDPEAVLESKIQRIEDRYE
jgi:NTP pyrophosphatase (non-canonical NTP hydrolase)